jgi:hypothetical protein
MALWAERAGCLDRLDDELRSAQALKPAIFSKLIAQACTRVPILHKAGKTDALARLIAAGAWTDAAFALIALELPGWTVRRLVCESGEWLCSLSRRPNIPVDLDDTADAVHDVIAIAALLAFLQARRMAAITPEAAAVVPRLHPATDGMICCDNFA